MDKMTANGWISVLIVVSLALSQSRQSLCLTVGDRSQNGNTSSTENGTIANQLIETLHDCRLHYAQLPDSYTRLSVYHLVLANRHSNTEKFANQPDAMLQRIHFHVGTNNDSLQQLHLKELNLDARLPFMFFTNGFNHDGKLDGTWMSEVARVYSRRYQELRGPDRSPGFNVIFLNWYMKGLLASNLMSMIPVYYKTMANYDIIVSRFQSAIQQIIDHLDELRSNLGGLRESRKDYYAKFRFYGHSLGSHIMAHALDGVHKDRPELIFGQIHGLDPAVPCFLNDQQGLTASRAKGMAHEVVVVHSNAGILGSFSERGQLEIVLNGGTFQPNCTLFDLNCHHIRSTEILGYVDDSCKMVAYKCNKYEQFKLGACETCDAPTQSMNRKLQANSIATPNCVLVNLEEQNEDSNLIASLSSNEQIRQLADNDGEGNDIYNFERATLIGSTLWARELDYMRNAKADYHFVNTNPKFKETKLGSHCLQHYQLRLLTLESGQSESIKGTKCPLKLLYGDKINIQLLQEPSEMIDKGFLRHQRDRMSKFELSAIVENQLYTGLGTFEGKPKLFVGAIIENIDLNHWLKCSAGQEKDVAKKEFVLDIAFMSHTRKAVRHAFSSVLCARWPIANQANDTPEAYSHKDETIVTDQLMLTLCHQSELSNVSYSINQLIRQVKFHSKFEQWHVILLNSLFSLFSGWEPL